jgi:hypothetical protein
MPSDVAIALMSAVVAAGLLKAWALFATVKWIVVRGDDYRALLDAGLPYRPD